MPAFYFFGDSITASDRLWLKKNGGLGDGYVSLLAAQLKECSPEAVFYNKGFDGFTAAALLRHLRQNPAPEAADYITVQIGINDVGVAMNTGVSLEAQNFPGHYEELLSDLLFGGRLSGAYTSGAYASDVHISDAHAANAHTSDVHASDQHASDVHTSGAHAANAHTSGMHASDQHASARILAVGPFIFPQPQEYARWIPTVRQAESIMEKIAAKFGVSFLPLQDVLNDAARRQGYSALTTDGIHLTPAGHQILAKLLLPYYLNKLKETSAEASLRMLGN